MANSVHLRRIDSKFFGVFQALIKFHSTIYYFAENPVDETLSPLADSAVNLDAVMEQLKATVESLIKEVAQAEDGNVDGIPSDNGFNLI